jgi:hypothetical protein
MFTFTLFFKAFPAGVYCLFLIIDLPRLLCILFGF